MPGIRIGRSTAEAAGASLMDMARFMQANQQSEQARQDQQQYRQQADRQNLVDRLARQMLEQEKIKAEADKAAAEQAKGAGREQAFNSYRDEYLAIENPDPATAARLALKHGVADDDRVKNFLSNNLGAGRFGESQAENVRKGQRFGDQMRFKSEKASSDLALLDRRLKQNEDQFGQELNEKKRHNLAMERTALLSAKQRVESSRFDMLRKNGYDVNEDNYVEALAELEDLQKDYDTTAAAQVIGFPDPATSISLQKKAAELSKLREAIRMYELSLGDSETRTHSESQDAEAVGDSATPPIPVAPKPATPPIPVAPKPAADPKKKTKPKKNIRKATLEDF